MTTSDIREALLEKYLKSDCRNNGTIEIQNAHFEADKDFIVPFNRFKEDWSDKWYEEFYTPIVNKQFDYIVNKLTNNECDRQAVVCMASQGEHQSGGYICTVYLQMFLNGNQLDWLVNMRSNDVMRYPYDLKWNKQIQRKFCKALSEKLGRHITPGKIFWNAGSLHIYKDDWKYLYLKN